ncbi:hypothetical protein L0636_13490 [Halomonas janggokensis]|uniref:Uncharacterized protein n=1 Tax=Vreelandella janggokensis TaxID=370767 RepID=A0ABT4IYE7_9GAMM|nr:hypothetical protein [Halomonas janggokensis]MCZ0928701.1 hypothetical protein [Halomonas janggokensis]MCZ0931436.1 hypothetical protein [Halomonas janggokensis]
MNLKPVMARIKFNDMKAPHPERHRNRIRKIADAVEERFPKINRSEKIKLKHIQWFLSHWLEAQGYSPTTRADYISSLKLLIEALERSSNWQGLLGLKPKGAGGRPRKSRVVKSKKYY